MGMNYDWVPVVGFTHHRINAIHLGKSSGGWCFGLHVYPERGINTLDDWDRLLQRPGSGVFDELHRLITRKKLLVEITERWTEPVDRGEKFYRDQYAEPGPNGMLRHKIIEGRCIGHGPGTWDYLIGNFG